MERLFTRYQISLLFSKYHSNDKQEYDFVIRGELSLLSNKQYVLQELDATRADLSSLRELVKDMGGWVQQVQQLQSEKEGEKEEVSGLEHIHFDPSCFELHRMFK